MKVYIDVYYYTDKDTDKEYARTVAGIFETYDDITFKDIVITRTDNIALYEPGNFYKRELPCIVDVLKECWKRGYILDTIIIDGYCHMCEDDGVTYHKGLGVRLKEYLRDNSLPCVNSLIIGIAKHPYKYLYDNTFFEYDGKLIKYSEFNKENKLPKKAMYITFCNVIDELQEKTIVDKIYNMKRVQKGSKFSLLFSLIDQETKRFKYDN